MLYFCVHDTAITRLCGSLGYRGQKLRIFMFVLFVMNLFLSCHVRIPLANRFLLAEIY